MKTWQKGEKAKLKVIERAIEKGCTVSLPTFEQSRYDAIIDNDGKLERVQIKYAGQKSSKSQGVAIADLRRANKNTMEYRKYNSEEIDAVMVYVPEKGIVCRFPPSIFENKASLNIRYAASKNGQSKGCLLIEDYKW